MKTARHLVVLALLLALVGCGTGSESDSTSGGDGEAAVDRGTPAPAAVVPQDGALDEAAGKTADEATPGSTSATAVREAALIQRGQVSSSAEDVRKARLQAQAVATRYGGEVTDSESASDRDGEATFAHLVLRVPAASFSKAMADLEKIGTLRDSSTSSEDVTTKLIDTEARVKVQRASIDRIRALLSAAKEIGDVVRIESELSRREAELDSLLQQQAYLADQTSRSTITVSISRTDEDEPDEDRDGFLGGLERGWDGLVAFTSGTLLVVGMVVPWLPLVAALVLAAAWLVRRRRTAPAELPG